MIDCVSGFTFILFTLLKEIGPLCTFLDAFTRDMDDFDELKAKFVVMDLEGL